MAIEPEYQRRGAGAELLKSGLRVADKINAAVSMLVKLSSRMY
jgi:predicted acetyltransferase